MMKFNSKYTQRHAFHLVDPSAMPLLTSVSALTVTIGSVLYFHGYIGGFETFVFGVISTTLCMAI
jgi:hypothetical protein